MKVNEKRRARELRLEGYSIGDISARIGVSKSSVSIWVREVELTPVQRSRLSRNGYSMELIEKRRQKRLANINARRAELMAQAAHDLNRLSTEQLWLIGVALYWGEGGKTVRGGVRLSNSDPAVIRLMMKFFRDVCRVPEEKFRGHIHTFSHLNSRKAEMYWSKISGIPRGRFYKTYTKPSIASKNKKDNLPYGTFQVYVHDTVLFFKIVGWIERIKELTGSKAVWNQ